jgi:hypothetical protein
MVKAFSEQNIHPQTYQQALDDFGITKLLLHLSNYSDADFKAASMNLEEQELESLAALLIQHLTNNLKGKLIVSYLNAIRHGDSDVQSRPINREIPPPSIDLPANFSDAARPCYQEGDRVRWQPLTDETDWGVVIGRFYAYARHQCQWAICYLIKLDQNSPSAAWTVTDTVWEQDLEPITDNGWARSSDHESFLPSLRTQQQCDRPTEPKGSELTTPTITTANSGSSAALTRSLPHPLLSLHTPPGSYSLEGRDRSHPRTLTQRERNLIQLYSHCQLGMTPMTFYAKWSVSYELLASICSRSTSTVRRWFIRGRHYRRPTTTDLRHLALMDFLLEYFEEIPSALLNFLCSPKPVR